MARCPTEIRKYFVFQIMSARISHCIVTLDTKYYFNESIALKYTYLSYNALRPDLFAIPDAPDPIFLCTAILRFQLLGNFNAKFQRQTANADPMTTIESITIIIRKNVQSDFLLTVIFHLLISY